MKCVLFGGWFKSISLRSHDTDSGFTLLEVLVVVIIIGILGAIAAPGWLGYLNRRRVISTRDDVYQSILQAQTTAKQRSVAYQVSFRETDSVLQWSIHPEGVTPSVWETAQSENVELDTGCPGTTSTTLDPFANTPSTIEFDFKGNLSGTPGVGTLYFGDKMSGGGEDDGPKDPTLSAIQFSTLIGGIRKVNKECVP